MEDGKIMKRLVANNHRVKEEGWSHILKCEETRSWREELIDKRFTSIDPEIGIRRIVTKNDKLHKIGLYLRKYKEKWKMSVKKYEEK
jgi:hypothetical protein